MALNKFDVMISLANVNVKAKAGVHDDILNVAVVDDESKRIESTKCYQDFRRFYKNNRRELKELGLKIPGRILFQSSMSIVDRINHLNSFLNVLKDKKLSCKAEMECLALLGINSPEMNPGIVSSASKVSSLGSSFSNVVDVEGNPDHFHEIEVDCTKALANSPIHIEISANSGSKYLGSKSIVECTESCSSTKSLGSHGNVECSYKEVETSSTECFPKPENSPQTKVVSEEDSNKISLASANVVAHDEDQSIFAVSQSKLKIPIDTEIIMDTTVVSPSCKGESLRKSEPVPTNSALNEIRDGINMHKNNDKHNVMKVESHDIISDSIWLSDKINVSSQLDSSNANDMEVSAHRLESTEDTLESTEDYYSNVDEHTKVVGINDSSCPVSTIDLKNSDDLIKNVDEKLNLKERNCDIIDNNRGLLNECWVGENSSRCDKDLLNKPKPNLETNSYQSGIKMYETTKSNLISKNSRSSSSIESQFCAENSSLKDKNVCCCIL